MERPTEHELLEKVANATTLIEVGALYCHYKNENGLYRVTQLVIRQEDYRIGVVYVAQYGEKLLWERPLDEFLELVEHEGKTVPRFVRV